MANLHFIVEAVASAREHAEAEPKRVSLHVEVEGSAPIKSQTDLLRATRVIAAEAIERAVGTKTLGELRVAEVKSFETAGQPLTSAAWPGTYVWPVGVQRTT